MLQIENKTPLSVALSPFLDSRGANLVSIAAKGTFSISTGQEPPSLACAQTPVELVETPFNEPYQSVLRVPADLVPGKAATDVGAVSHAYGRKSWLRRRIPISVSVGPLSKRAWIQPDANDDADERSLAPVAQAIGFVPSNADRRIKFAGTYDANWKSTQLPLPPLDLSPLFFNCATAGLTADGFLSGPLPVDLNGLSPRGRLRFTIPNISIRFTYRFQSRELPSPAALWTVLLQPDRDEFCLVWGACVDVGLRPSALHDVLVEAEGL